MSTIKSSAENLTLNADGSGNDVLIQSNGSTKAIVTAEGTLGIGTTAPLRQLHISNTSANPEIAFTSGTSGAASLLFGDGLTGTDVYKGYVQYQHNGDYMLIATGATTRLRVDSDGLKFNADTAAANALDDYEEGTWTPSFGADNQGFTIGSTAASTGKYIKIGKLVHFQMYVNITGSTPTSQGYRISGLPFANNSSTYAFFPIGGTYSGANANAIHDKAQWRLDHNGTTFRFYIASENALKDGSEAWGGSNTEYSFNVSGTYMMTI